jgi:hypothetical protein
MSLAHEHQPETFPLDHQEPQQLLVDIGLDTPPLARPSPRNPSVAMTVIPEAPGRFRRCCPFCNEPVVWRYFGRIEEDDAIDLKTERPYCQEHGPLSLWRVIDFGFALGPAIVSIAKVHDLPLVHGRARILPRFLGHPILARRARPASSRWKHAKPRHAHPRALITIDLASLAGRARSRAMRRLLSAA